MKILFGVKEIIKYLIIPAGVLYGTLFKRGRGIKILMYHRVKDDIQMELAVKINEFRWQMAYLKKKGYTVISMDEACERIENNDIQDKLIVLTFDDGYEDYFYNAYPILEENSFPSIVYLVPSYIETGKVFWWDRSQGSSPLLNWSQLEELKQKGLVQFGSHTMSHPNLHELNNSNIKKELYDSKLLIESRLDVEVNHFCYPGGYNNEISKHMVSKIYTSGVSICDGTHINTRNTRIDLSSLKRIPVQKSDGRLIFIARLKGWMWFEEVASRLKQCKLVKGIFKKLLVREFGY